MKRIYITESQLKRALSIINEDNIVKLDITKGNERDNSSMSTEDAENLRKGAQAMKNAGLTTVVEFDPQNSGDVQKVSKALNNESKTISLTKDPIEGDVNVPQQVVDFILNNYEDITCDSTISQIKDAIQDAYIECFGEEMEYDNNSLYSEIINLLMDRLCSSVNESVIVFTKKQIKEAKKAKRIQESKVLTKGEILKSVK